MADSSYLEKHQLEKLFHMSDGYVLDSSNRTFQDSIAVAVRRNIDDAKYNYASGSKTNRLRPFWKVEPNQIVGRLTQAMVEYAKTMGGIEPTFIAGGRKVARSSFKTSS